MNKCCDNCKHIDKPPSGIDCEFVELDQLDWDISKDFCSKFERGNNNIYKHAIDKFGMNNQIIKTMEELAELQVELAKFFDMTNKEFDSETILEEIADVEIMIEQLKIIFDCRDIIETVKGKKLDRLKGLIEND